MIENHVTNLALSKRLTELGVKQNSIYYWVQINNKWIPLIFDNPILAEFEYYSAFLSSELLEMLPWDTGYFHEPTIRKNRNNNYEFSYIGMEIKSVHENICTSLANILIHIIENNLVTDEWRKEWLNVT